MFVHRGNPHYLGLSTSCSRFPKKWLEGSFSKSLSKGVQKSQKLLFLTKVAPFIIWFNAKICKLYNKSKIYKQAFGKILSAMVDT